MQEPPVEVPAVEVLSARLQVGRVLRGRLLAVAVALRSFFVSVGTLGLWSAEEELAPTWVVLSRRATGQELAWLPGGRGPGDGQALLDEVEQALHDLSEPAFLQRYGLAP